MPFASPTDGMERFFRHDLQHLNAYSASKSPETMPTELAQAIVKLDANENPYGCSPRVYEALNQCPSFNLYPDSTQKEIRQDLAAYTLLPPENIVAGAGSDQIIDLLMRLFIEPEDEIIDLVPSFGMYRFYALLHRGRVIEVARRDDFSVDVEEVKKAITPKTKLIFLANPNNPSGSVTREEDIEYLLGLGVPLVVDEAYYEFYGHTVAGLIKRYDNLLVLRSFSKWAGLAGFRIGYGLFPEPVAAYLMRIKDPYGVSVAAQVAVRASLGDMAWLKARVKDIISERERLFYYLQNVEWLRAFHSQANFVLCQVLDGRAKQLAAELEQKGVLVRYFDRPRLSDCIRISVGRPQDTDKLVETINSIRRY